MAAVTFPPAGPTGMTRVIPAYLYDQYSDDADLQAFIDAYNALAQQYVDWFNNINLPIYTGPLIAGGLLDWVATNLYGLPRPVLSIGRRSGTGPFNTAQFNTLQFNGYTRSSSGTFYTVSDDIYKRILTWHFYKGDGPVASIRWLKRRVARFLAGANGTDAPAATAATYEISITISAGAMTITLSGAAASNAAATMLQAAMATGVLEMPFQVTAAVVISS
ncbi:MAG TPA: hypothetical protein VGC09_00540 [Rhodopila sp.]